MEEEKEVQEEVKKEEKKEIKITLGTFTVLIVSLLVLVVTIIFAVYIKERLLKEQQAEQNTLPISIQITEKETKADETDADIEVVPSN